MKKNILISAVVILNVAAVVFSILAFVSHSGVIIDNLPVIFLTVYMMLLLIGLLYTFGLKELNDSNLGAARFGAVVSIFSYWECLNNVLLKFYQSVSSIPVLSLLFITPLVVLLTLLRFKFGKEQFRLLMLTDYIKKR